MVSKQLGIAGISPEQEPTARQLAEIQQFVKDYQVKTIFVEKHTSSKVADSIAKATGARVKVLDPLEADPQNDKDLLKFRRKYGDFSQGIRGVNQE